MRIVQIIGGLGNQMFQYAFYKALRYYSKEEVKIDISEFKGYKLHNGFELENLFFIEKNILASEEEIKKLKDTRPLFKVRKKLKILKKSHYIENHFFKFRNEIFLLNNKYFQGYWQNENYFKMIENIIRKDFRFKKELNKKSLKILKRIKEENSISIHIRRGDYLKYPQYQGVCTLEYYNKAINYIKNKIENPKFYIFSNDLEWCKEQFSENYIFINFNKGEDSWMDMYLMSECKHNIIANSSFSWWGAWLNQNIKKIVITPNEWTKNSEDSKEIISLKWTKEENLND